MKRTWTVVVLMLALVPAAGCGFYFGGDDDDDCLDYGGAIAPEELRNPQTGQCESFGGDWYGCDPAPGAPEPWPDWGWCYSECTGLDEQSCQDASGCRAIYVGSCPEGLDCDNTTYEYSACWATAQSGPVQGGGCSTLDAYECSRHDDCVAYHYPFECPPNADCTWPPGPSNFEACGPEPQNPDGSCYEPVACDAIGPDCPAGTVPGVADGCYTGACIDYDACEPPLDPGNCYEEVECLAFAVPVCPEGSVPGVIDGCWSGYCIPEADCEAPPACEQVATEIACVDRADCAPIYEGVDCSCDANGDCSCADWVFQSCQTGAQPTYLVR